MLDEKEPATITKTVVVDTAERDVRRHQQKHWPDRENKTQCMDAAVVGVDVLSFFYT